MSGDQATRETTENAASSSPDLTSYDVVDEYPAVPSEPTATATTLQQQPSNHIPVSYEFFFGGGGGQGTGISFSGFISNYCKGKFTLRESEVNIAARWVLSNSTF